MPTVDVTADQLRLVSVVFTFFFLWGKDMKLKQNDLIRVYGWVMLQGLQEGDYRVRRVSEHHGRLCYVLTRPRGKKSVKHFCDSVDSWVRPAGHPDINKIEVVGKGIEEYTCTGSVRGNCGIRHRSIGAAVACCRLDGVACRKQGGYSDREVQRCDGRPMSEDELAEESDCQNPPE